MCEDVCKRLDYERWRMKIGHYAAAAVLLVVGYYLGTKYPNLLKKVTG